jgi:glycerophosphoryl diester phosphodiesterase
MIKTYSILSFCFVMACSNIKSLQSPPLSVPEFDKQGHRGCRGLMPENTVAGMIKALELGVNTLEMDVVISKDKKVVLSHEPWFGHEVTTRPDGSFIDAKEERKFNLFEMNYEEIKTYDVGLKPHPRFPKQEKIKAIKPLLTDLIDSINVWMMTRRRPFPQFNIETKSFSFGDNKYHPAPSEFIELLMAVIKEKGMEDRVTIQSFDLRTLQYLHEKYPGIKTSMLVEEAEEKDLEGQLQKLGFTPTIYSPHQNLVDEEMIKQCHEKGMKVIPWTVNDKKQIKKLEKLGVDGIITDYPNLFNE